MKRDIMVRLMMSKEEKEILEKVCEQRYMNISQLLRTLVIEEYRKLDK